MIVLMHVATGAAAGAATRSRRRAAVLGPLLHFACDVVPHEDIPSHPFEATTGIAAIVALAWRRGIDAATVGAIASSAPDLEHVLRLPRPGGGQLFPSHRWPLPTASRRLPAWVQLAIAIPTIAALTRRR